MAVIRPKDEPASTSVAVGDVFLVDGTDGVRALAASLVPLTNSANTFSAAQTFGTLVATTVNGNTITAGTGVLTIAAAKTLTASNSLTLAGTDGTTQTFPSTSAILARTDAAQTFTGTQTVGALVATTVNGNTITTGTGVLTLTAGKTLRANNTLTLAGTDGTTQTFPTTSASVARTDAAQTFTGTQTFGTLVATSVNGNTITTGTGVLTIAAAKTLTVSNSLTLAGTDGTTQTFPSTSGAVVSSVSVNAVTNAMSAQMAAYTLKGNATGALANATDIDVTALTLKASPVSGDIVLIQDSAASNAFKRTTVGAIATAGSVSSINGATGAFTGILTGTRLAKTAAYTVSSADNGATVAMSGAALYQLTLPSSTGFSTSFCCRALNEDPALGKRITAVYATSSTSLTIGTGSKAFTVAAGLDFNGYFRWRAYSLADPTKFMAGTVASYASTTLTLTVDTTGGSGTFIDWQIAFEFILFPRQSVSIEMQNGVWQIYERTRWRIPGSMNIYVDTGGSLVNDGLSLSTALPSITSAVEMLYEHLDGGGYTKKGVANARAVTILVTGGQSFNEAVFVIGQPTGMNAFTIKGNGSQFTWTSSTFGCSVGDNGEVIFDTIAWNCNSSNAAATAAVMGHNNAIFDFFGPHLFIGNGSNCSAIYTDAIAIFSTSNDTNGFVVSGTFGDVVHMDKGGEYTIGAVLKPSGTTNVTRAYFLNGGAHLNIGAQMQTTGWTSIGASVANFNSCGHLNGTTITGSTGQSQGGLWA